MVNPCTDVWMDSSFHSGVVSSPSEKAKTKLLCLDPLQIHFPFFWDHNIITSFSTSLSSPHALPYAFLCSLSNWWPLFSLVAIICKHASICMYIPKSKLLSLYNVTCMYIFSDEHLVSSNQWYSLSWGWLCLPLLTLLTYWSSLCRAEASSALSCSFGVGGPSDCVLHSLIE